MSNIFFKPLDFHGLCFLVSMTRMGIHFQNNFKFFNIIFQHLILIFSIVLTQLAILQEQVIYKSLLQLTSCE